MEIKLEPQEIEVALKQYIQSKFNSHVTTGCIQTADREGVIDCCGDGVSNTYYIQVHAELPPPTQPPTPAYPV